MRSIYREIMSSALSLEKTMTVVYLGPEATFTQQAAIRKFGSSLNYVVGQTRANSAIALLGAAGDLAVYTAQAGGSLDLIVDVNGYFR